MANLKTSGIVFLVLLIVLMLFLGTIPAVLTEETSDGSTDVSDIDYNQLLTDTIDEISTYIQIKDLKGKNYKIDGEFKIKKVALLVSPLVTQNIDISQLTIQIDNGEMVSFLSYLGFSEKLDSNTLFEHSIWNNLSGHNFSFISDLDLDESLVEFNVLNDNTDRAYLVFELPESMYMKKYDSITVSLFPGSGTPRKITLKAPMPMSRVVNLE